MCGGVSGWICFGFGVVVLLLLFGVSWLDVCMFGFFGVVLFGGCDLDFWCLINNKCLDSFFFI